MRKKSFNDNGNRQIKKKTVIGIVIAAVILALILATFGFFAALASTDKVYKGVHVGDLDLGGKSRDQAVKLIEQEYGPYETSAKLEFDGVPFDIYSNDISMALDAEASADMAVGYGKKGTIFTKIINMLGLEANPQKLDVVLAYDEAALQNILNDELSEALSDVTDYTVEFGENELIVTNGKDGKGILASDVIAEIANAFTNNRLDTRLKVDIKVIPSEKIDPEEFCKEYNRRAINAVCEEDGANINIVPEIVGVQIDKDEAIAIIKANENNTESYTIPAEITYPEVTAAQLEEEYTDTVIGTYSTNYSSSSANRKENIRLASSKINGVILNPGDVFSFNGIVGPRTAETGYKIAQVYSGSKAVDGIGGGICQVSSTLYNAVVLADLEIVYRTNHSLPVSYVPLGRDATVSYGTIDFKFANNKQSPIKLEVIADGATLTVNIYGRKKYIKDISIETAVVGSVPYSTKEIEDATMAEGEKVVEEKGAAGTRVEAYKIVKENGEVVSRSLLAKSSYTPTTEVVRVGTAKVQPNPGVVEPPVVEDLPVDYNQPYVEPPVVMPDVVVPDVVVPEVPSTNEVQVPPVETVPTPVPDEY